MCPFAAEQKFTQEDKIVRTRWKRQTRWYKEKAPIKHNVTKDQQVKKKKEKKEILARVKVQH